RGTDTLPEARLLAVPLWVGDGSAGVVAVELDRARRRIEMEPRLLLEAIARQAGVAIARLTLATEARAAALKAQAEELRSSLLSTVSHDLRTPLAVITGMASTLRDDAPPAGWTPDQLESLDTIVDEAGRLGKILTNLLAITRVESGAEVRREWVPVEELVGAALDRADAALTGHPVALAVDPEVGVMVDPILTEQLLLNLLENAAKHTPPGTPIEVRAVRADRDRGDGDGGSVPGVAIEVSDHGPGLPPGPEAQVFDKFFRGQDVRAAGAGLGLAVCRGIATAHGGTITALRRHEGGATFRVWLPGGAPPVELPDADEDRAATAPPPPVPPP
ncbi:MAG: histidine kinase, partial [Deltaproteobacteria bacterium]|nr:histidine kinase [Deltaproteobacteria bacterium]